MKYLKHITIYLFVGVLFACDSSTPDVLQQTAQELFILDISKTWDVSNKGTITQDGVDITSQFPNFVLTIGNKTYNSSGGLNLWLDGSGTWDFANSETITEIVVDGVPMEVTLASGTLTLSFNLANAAIGGRLSSVTGNFIISVSQ